MRLRLYVLRRHFQSLRIEIGRRRQFGGDLPEESQAKLFQLLCAEIELSLIEAENIARWFARWFENQRNKPVFYA